MLPPRIHLRQTLSQGPVNKHVRAALLVKVKRAEGEAIKGTMGVSQGLLWKRTTLQGLA